MLVLSTYLCAAPLSIRDKKAGKLDKVTDPTGVRVQHGIYTGKERITITHGKSFQRGRRAPNEVAVSTGSVA